MKDTVFWWLLPMLLLSLFFWLALDMAYMMGAVLGCHELHPELFKVK